MYCDLHNHLYGSLSPKTLFEIGKANPSPRWHLFLDSYQKTFGQAIDPKRFFEEYGNLDSFQKLYCFNEKAPFSHFQAKFNLIIALVVFDEKEIRDVTRTVLKTHAEQKVSYAEYRLMFGKEEPKEGFFRKLIAACEGLNLAEGDLNKEKVSGRLAMSLHRDANFERNYDWIKNWMEKEDLIRNYLVGIDFCHVEEGFPPKDKRDFFDSVLRDNKAEPDTALAILYHVGESFQDKTPFSAARWVLEAAKMGAHRLGHALSLGIEPDFFLHQTRTESRQERLDQLNFELESYSEICGIGDYYSKEELDISRKQLLKDTTPSTNFTMDEKSIGYLKTFQNYCLSQIAKTRSVIETCPTSNHLIGMLPDPKAHPAQRFFESGVSLTISTDDPGIFDTTIEREYELANVAGLNSEQLETIRKQSFLYKSTVLSGREIG